MAPPRRAAASRRASPTARPGTTPLPSVRTTDRSRQRTCRRICTSTPPPVGLDRRGVLQAERHRAEGRPAGRVLRRVPGGHRPRVRRHPRRHHPLREHEDDAGVLAGDAVQRPRRSRATARRPRRRVSSSRRTSRTRSAPGRVRSIARASSASGASTPVNPAGSETKGDFESENLATQSSNKARIVITVTADNPGGTAIDSSASVRPFADAATPSSTGGDHVGMPSTAASTYSGTEVAMTNYNLHFVSTGDWPYALNITKPHVPARPRRQRRRHPCTARTSSPRSMTPRTAPKTAPTSCGASRRPTPATTSSSRATRRAPATTSSTSAAVARRL